MSLEACFLVICSRQNETVDLSTTTKKTSRRPSLSKVYTQLEEDVDAAEINQHEVPCEEHGNQKSPIGVGNKVNQNHVPKKTLSWSHASAVVKVLLWRNLLFSKKNLPLLLFQLFIPLATINLISVSVGTNIFDVPVGVVNEEDPADLSEAFIDSIDSAVLFVSRYANISEGLDAVRRADVYGVFHIKKDFSTCLKLKVELGLAANEQIVNCSSIKGHFDNTQSIQAGLIKRTILNSYKRFMADFLREQGIHVEATSLPIDMSKAVFGYEDEPFRDFLLPGGMVILIYYMAVLANLMTFILEANSGLQDRLRVSGVTSGQLFVSHFITQSVIVLGQVPLALTTPLLLFGLPLHGSLLLAYFLLVLQGIGGVTYGFFISTLTSNGVVAITVYMANLCIIMYISSFLWPLESVNHAFRIFGYCLPVTLPNEALRSIFCRGWGITHRSVYLALISSFTWIGVFLMLTVMILKFKKK